MPTARGSRLEVARISAGGDREVGATARPVPPAAGIRALAVVAALAFACPGQSGRVVERVSVSSEAVQGNDISGWPSISADGRFVAFCSLADNLVPGDTNGDWDVFLRDRVKGRSERVSVTSDGREANGNSLWPSISPDGRYVAFTSWADNLVPGDANRREDVFVHDRLTHTTRRLEAAGWKPSALPVRERDISADGRWIAFQSDSPGLVPGDTNGVQDVFVAEVAGDTTPPETEIVPWPCGDVWPFGVVAFRWQGRDNETAPEQLTYLWRLDAADWQGPTPATHRWDLVLSLGQHLFEVKARDLAANEDPTPAQYPFAVQLGTSLFRILSPPEFATVRGVADLCVDATHPVGVLTVTFSVGSTRLYEATGPCGRYCYAWDTRSASAPEGAVSVGFEQRVTVEGGSAGVDLIRCLTIDNTTFDDVAKSKKFWRFVEGLAEAGLTGGCSASPPLYCPNGVVTRAQAAFFICAAGGKTWLDKATPTFADVPRTHPFYGWIERLAEGASWGGSAPTAGCRTVGTQHYFCPGYAATRDQAAKLLCTARGKTPLNSSAPTFADVPATYLFYGWIQRLADSASWGGNPPAVGRRIEGATRYFEPAAYVTRAEMAKLLVLAFGLPYYQG